MGHHHHTHATETSGIRLFITILLNFLITAAEILGGIVLGSLSLISDVLYNLSDGVAGEIPRFVNIHYVYSGKTW